MYTYADCNSGKQYAQILGSPTEKGLRYACRHRPATQGKEKQEPQCFIKALPTINYNQRPCQRTSRRVIRALLTEVRGMAIVRTYVFVARSLLSALAHLGYPVGVPLALSLISHSYPVSGATRLHSEVVTVITRKNKGDLSKG